jgi:glutamate formiminotransferase/formiminotetrahydrofolate cyclodeaminase
MVANLTHGKKKYADVWEEMEEIAVEAQHLKDEYLRLVDRDTEAFDALMAAMKLPKKTEEEIRIRNEKIQEATRRAIEVPLTSMRLSRRLLALAEALAEKGNRNALSDAGVAALMAYSAAYGAYLNVIINLPGVEDEGYRESVRGEAEEILKEVVERHRAVLEKVRGQL